MKRINQQKIKELKRLRNWILLVTVNEIERNCVVDSLMPLQGERDVFEGFNNKNTYHIGRFGAYNAVHVQSDMGAVGRDASITTVDRAIKLWKPKALMMIGVAWGANEEKQKIGDVMVSRVVTPFEMAKISKGQIIPRGVDSEPGSILLDRFCKHMGWSHTYSLNEASKTSRMIDGIILSGEKLLDDKEYRDALLSQNPEAIGGEMEGAGVATACKNNDLPEWILIKGICDWGYNKQSEHKDKYQQIAVAAAVSLCLSVLSTEEVLESLMKSTQVIVSLTREKVRINSYKLFFYREDKKMSQKSLAKATGLTENCISRLEKINTNEDEYSIAIFPIATLTQIKSLDKTLGLTKGESLRASYQDIAAVKYKNFYVRRKGVKKPSVKAKNARAVLFDFDGTLVSAGTLRTTWERIWVALGYPVMDCEELHKQYSDHIITHREWCKITEERFKAKGLELRHITHVADQLRLIDDVKPTLELLNSRGVLLFIVSGSIDKIIASALGDLASIFKDIAANTFIFTEDKLSKIIGTLYDFEGKADYVKKISAEYDIPANEILFVGNSFNDAHVHTSGARTLCINPTNTNYTNSTYWNDFIKETKSLLDILPYVFPEEHHC